MGLVRDKKKLNKHNNEKPQYHTNKKLLKNKQK